MSHTLDPRAGSYFVEWLTDEMERRISGSLARIEALGGMVRPIKKGCVQAEIAQSAFAYQMDVEAKGKIIAPRVSGGGAGEAGRGRAGPWGGPAPACSSPAPRCR